MLGQRILQTMSMLPLQKNEYKGVKIKARSNGRHHEGLEKRGSLGGVNSTQVISVIRAKRSGNHLDGESNPTLNARKFP